MKIVILDGTHNKSGMTLKLVDKFLAGVESVGPRAEVVTHDLLNGNISFCKGCGKCTEDKDPVNAKCMIVDDEMEAVKQAALSADVLVFATPIYEYCVSSAMKRFLERSLTLVTFKFGPTARAKAIKGKVGVVICSSGAPFPFNHLMGITRYPKFMLNLACKLYRCDRVIMVLAGGMAASPKLKNKWEDKALNAGKAAALGFSE
ncbi:flavodoxin family protein [Candidatus Falkowbacteria bacterium]|nr:flavodoxin family protein [Candidatus Falkowbacteria bacterium]